MKNNEKTFTLTINSMDNSEWQGTLQVPGGGTVQFSSILELLEEVTAQIETMAKAE
ncbi:MAG: hypothetical protein VB096_03745 [Pseudoflavonifractor sp.]|nr:hypothetical protein [Pseudoflavonifractor sp.]